MRFEGRGCSLLGRTSVRRLCCCCCCCFWASYNHVKIMMAGRLEQSERERKREMKEEERGTRRTHSERRSCAGSIDASAPPRHLFSKNECLSPAARSHFSHVDRQRSKGKERARTAADGDQEQRPQERVGRCCFIYGNYLLYVYIYI